MSDELPFPRLEPEPPFEHESPYRYEEDPPKLSLPARLLIGGMDAVTATVNRVVRWLDKGRWT